jgi:hypothetical protein
LGRCPDGIIEEGKEGNVMAIPTDVTEREREEESFEQRIARLRATPEQIARLVGDTPPFDFDAWMAEAGPPTPEELVEMEEFLREREEERQRSLAREQERFARLGE